MGIRQQVFHVSEVAAERAKPPCLGIIYQSLFRCNKGFAVLIDPDNMTTRGKDV